MRNKRKKAMRIRRITSSSPCLILVMKVERSLLKSASGARKFLGVLDRMSMKLQSKLGGCMIVRPSSLRAHAHECLLEYGRQAKICMHSGSARERWFDQGRVPIENRLSK
eukprot:354713-Pelagomonas_calceolata.AAC.2